MPKSVNKAMAALPNGETLAERTIRLYTSAGFNRFTLLTGHDSSSIVSHIGTGQDLGAQITYCDDPFPSCGRGRAIANALQQKKIRSSDLVVVHNPDDQIVSYPGNPGAFPADLLSAHNEGQHLGHYATAVIADGTRYNYTAMTLDQNTVVDVQAYPFLKLFTHVGITVLSPNVFQKLIEMFVNSTVGDFELPIFDWLARSKRLYSMTISHEHWVPVNDPKGFESLLAHISR